MVPWWLQRLQLQLQLRRWCIYGAVTCAGCSWLLRVKTVREFELVVENYASCQTATRSGGSSSANHIFIITALHLHNTAFIFVLVSSGRCAGGSWATALFHVP